MTKIITGTTYNSFSDITDDETFLDIKAIRLEESIASLMHKINTEGKYSEEELLVFTERLFNCTESLKRVRERLGGAYSSLSSFGF